MNKNQNVTHVRR